MTGYYEDENFKGELGFELSDDLEFYNCTFSNINLTECRSRNSKFIECSFVSCNLSNADFRFSVFRNSSFNQCKIIGLNWASLGACSQLIFLESVLDYSIFNNVNWESGVFNNCSLKNVDFSSSRLRNTSFCGCSLVGSSFHGADLSVCDFRQATGFNIDIRHCNIKGAKFSMPEAMNLLSALEIKIESQ